MTHYEVEAMLTNVYNAYAKGKGAANIKPLEITCSPEVHDTFSAGLIASERLGVETATPHQSKMLAFKTARLIRADSPVYGTNPYLLKVREME